MFRNLVTITTISLGCLYFLPPPIPQAPKPPKKLKPARKQVKPGDVEKTEAVQTGKEYSAFGLVRDIYKAIKGLIICVIIDIWYNKWAGGDREDSYSKYVPFS